MNCPHCYFGTDKYGDPCEHCAANPDSPRGHTLDRILWAFLIFFTLIEAGVAIQRHTASQQTVTTIMLDDGPRPIAP